MRASRDADSPVADPDLIAWSSANQSSTVGVICLVGFFVDLNVRLSGYA
jgi:hypothetical protein